jgi:excinuclease ABC subunit A
MKLDRYKNHDIEVVIDKLIVGDKDDKRLKQALPQLCVRVKAY